MESYNNKIKTSKFFIDLKNKMKEELEIPDINNLFSLANELDNLSVQLQEEKKQQLSKSNELGLLEFKLHLIKVELDKNTLIQNQKEKELKNKETELIEKSKILPNNNLLPKLENKQNCRIFMLECLRRGGEGRETQIKFINDLINDNTEYIILRQGSASNGCNSNGLIITNKGKIFVKHIHYNGFNECRIYFYYADYKIYEMNCKLLASLSELCKRGGPLNGGGLYDPPKLIQDYIN